MINLVKKHTRATGWSRTGVEGRAGAPFRAGCLGDIRKGRLTAIRPGHPKGVCLSTYACSPHPHHRDPASPLLSSQPNTTEFQQQFCF